MTNKLFAMLAHKMVAPILMGAYLLLVSLPPRYGSLLDWMRRE
jgi:hypothetical protein